MRDAVFHRVVEIASSSRFYRPSHAGKDSQRQIDVFFFLRNVSYLSIKGDDYTAAPPVSSHYLPNTYR